MKGLFKVRFKKKVPQQGLEPMKVLPRNFRALDSKFLRDGSKFKIAFKKIVTLPTKSGTISVIVTPGYSKTLFTLDCKGSF